MAPPQPLRKQTSKCSLLLIYRPQKDERLSWPSWLTYSGWFTHISYHPSATGRARDSESTPAKERPCTAGPLDHATNLLVLVTRTIQNPFTLNTFFQRGRISFHVTTSKIKLSQSFRRMQHVREYLWTYVLQMTATDDGENRRSHLSIIDMFSSFPGNVRVRHDVQCYVIGSRAIFSTIQDSPDRLSVLFQTWLHTRKKILSRRKSFLSIRTNHVSTPSSHKVI